MKLILVRHGETYENKEGIIQGHLNSILNETGKMQAEKLSERLKDEKIDIIYSSDLSRAHDTAKIVHKHHRESKLVITKELRERNNGVLEGKYGDNVDWSRKDYEGRESNEELIIRAEKFLSKTFKKHKGKTVMFSCHGGIGKAYVSLILDKNFKELDLKLENTSVSIFKIGENKNHEMLLLNDTKHLTE